MHHSCPIYWKHRDRIFALQHSRSATEGFAILLASSRTDPLGMTATEHSESLHYNSSSSNRNINLDGLLALKQI
jgi:hypothetical protein